MRMRPSGRSEQPLPSLLRTHIAARRGGAQGLLWAVIATERSNRGQTLDDCGTCPWIASSLTLLAMTGVGDSYESTMRIHDGERAQRYDLHRSHIEPFTARLSAPPEASNRVYVALQLHITRLARILRPNR